jgi:hypothetical protein
MNMRLLAWAVVCVPAWAQTQLGTGSLSGAITDPSDHIVTSARVVTVNLATGLTREVVSTSAGTFSAPVLPPGTYSVTVNAPGFAAWRADDVEINVGAAASLSVKLQLGTVAESVTVGASAVIDASQTDISSLVDRNEIHDLPINGRRYYDFALLTPGVTRDGRFGCSVSAALQATSITTWSKGTTTIRRTLPRIGAAIARRAR